ncbi:MAG: AhpC/TSA family protein, partial [Planctomycetota bacterium]|nr:AhpC/TSA family protein [Planctomycetota bacterium]
VWFRGFAAAILRGHGVGKLQGNGFQMAGTFLVHRGKIVNAHPLKDASDRPDYCSLATPQV